VPKPPLRAETLPPIIAPVVSVAGDSRDRLGGERTGRARRGPGAGGGVGTARASVSARATVGHRATGGGGQAAAPIIRAVVSSRPGSCAR
jgi:hypothetical protein